LLLERLTISLPSIEFDYSDSLPYNDYFSLIDRHFESRVDCEQINHAMDVCSKQFRAVQKRLLAKLKDKTPTLLDNLDILLENTSGQVRFDAL
jgi:Bardet-Biedl syndrome 9 protein